MRVVRVFAVRAASAGLLVLLAFGCSESPIAPVDESLRAPPDEVDALRWTNALWDRFRFWASSAPVLGGAGDIARCSPADDPTAIQPASTTPAAATARLLDRLPGTVITLGDNAYEFGSPADFALCYEPTWGRHKWRTRPSAGNHEYLTPGAAGYFAYFGPRAAPPGGYYSYDVGSWHVVVLNSTPQWALCPPPAASAEDGRHCAGDVVQKAWLEADLAANPSRCTLAYFHHPRFSSGKHGNIYEMQQFWDILYANGVDVVLSAHDHLYERFAPQDPDGNLDEERGIREFVVGTGGAEHYGFAEIQPNSEVRNNDTWGVLAVLLENGRYSWAFVPTPDGSFRDSGRDECH